MDASSSPLSFDSGDTLSMSMGLLEFGSVCPDNIEGTSETTREPPPSPPMADIFHSTLSSFDLEKFRRLYDIPEDIVLHSPGVSRRACHIQLEDVCLYEQALVAGFRFLVALFIRDLLLCVGLSST